jgi:hypothetical protein
MTKKSYALWAIIIVTCMTTVQSCKKGCTDAKAINYVPGVNHDDGSCLYCDSSVSMSYGGEYYAVDNTQGSPHNGQNVLEMLVYENTTVYTGNGCRQLGLGIATDSICNTATLLSILYNETPSTMVFSGFLPLVRGYRL